MSQLAKNRQDKLYSLGKKKKKALEHVIMDVESVIHSSGVCEG